MYTQQLYYLLVLLQGIYPALDSLDSTYLLCYKKILLARLITRLHKPIKNITMIHIIKRFYPLPLQLPLFSSKPSSPASKSSLERQANGFLVKSQLFIQIEISEHQLSLRNPHTKLEVLDIFPPHVQAIESLNSCTVNTN